MCVNQYVMNIFTKYEKNTLIWGTRFFETKGLVI
jgi:hypothetical protein